MRIFSIFLAIAWPLFSLVAQNPDETYVKDNFDKEEVYITMRDGVKLFTAIYT